MEQAVGMVAMLTDENDYHSFSSQIDEAAHHEHIFFTFAFKTDLGIKKT